MKRIYNIYEIFLNINFSLKKLKNTKSHCLEKNLIHLNKKKIIKKK